MNKCEILTMWEGDGLSESTAFSPQITTDYPTIQSYEDITGQPSANLTPNPNMNSVTIKCDDATLALIGTDANYYVSWANPIIEDVI